MEYSIPNKLPIQKTISYPSLTKDPNHKKEEDASLAINLIEDLFVARNAYNYRKDLRELVNGT
jgi:hypothetical protein